MEPPSPSIWSPRPTDEPTGSDSTGQTASGFGPYGGWPEPREQPQPPFEPERQSGFRRRIGAALAAIAAFFAKFKSVLLLLPKLKLISTTGTMFVSLAAYAWLWGWPFAAGFIALLFVHEMGHVIQLRREGVKASAPMFIPFLGAVISARSLGRNALAEARVGLAGPVLGSIGAAACILLWRDTGNDLFRALAFTGFFLNLFNLIPLSPLDGGRAMAAMSPWMWLVGLAMMLGVLFVFPNPLILVFLVIGGLDSWRRFKQRDQRQEYYRVGAVDRLLVASVYLSLIALLAIGMHAMNMPRSFG